MAQTAAFPMPPRPLTFKNKKHRIQWDLGEYQYALASQPCVSQLPASNNLPFSSRILEFEDTLVNSELPLQNDFSGVLPITSSSDSPFDFIAADIPYTGDVNAPAADEINIYSDQELQRLGEFTEESPVPGTSTRRQMGLHYPGSRRNSDPQPDFNLNQQDNQIKQYKRRKSHNIVERRYRVNLNGKFRKLEEVVLQGTTSSSSSSPCSSKQSSARSTTPSPRRSSSPQKTRSKAHILDNALAYIESLQNEINGLKETSDV